MVKTGKIKAGGGMFICNAGEHYVMAELLKREITAALAPRNAPAFDILAAKGNKTARIRVKTKSESQETWQYAVKKTGLIFKDFSENGDFTVLVNLADDTKNLKFYIIPTKIVEKWLQDDFIEWLTTPGKGGRPRSETNPKRHLSQKKHAGELKGYLNWDILWD